MVKPRKIWHKIFGCPVHLSRREPGLYEIHCTCGKLLWRQGDI